MAFGQSVTDSASLKAAGYILPHVTIIAAHTLPASAMAFRRSLQCLLLLTLSGIASVSSAAGFIYEIRGNTIFQHAKAEVFNKFFGSPTDPSKLLRAALAENFGPIYLSQALIPLRILAYDLGSEQLVVFDSTAAKLEPASDLLVSAAVLASCSVKDFFGPANVPHKDGAIRTYIDAGSMGVGVCDATQFLYDKMRLDLQPGDNALIFSVGTGFDKACEINAKSDESIIRVIRLEPDMTDYLKGTQGNSMLLNMKAADGSPEALKGLAKVAENLIKQNDEFGQLIEALWARSDAAAAAEAAANTGAAGKKPRDGDWGF